MEEAAGGEPKQEPDTPKPKRKPPKRKKKFGKYTRVGGAEESFCSKINTVNTIIDGNQAPAAVMHTTSSDSNKVKAAKSELIRAAAYAERETGKSKRRYQALNEAMATQQAKLSAKAKECQEVA